MRIQSSMQPKYMCLMKARGFMSSTHWRSTVSGMHLVAPDPPKDLKSVTAAAYKEALQWWTEEKQRKLEALSKIEATIKRTPMEKASGDPSKPGHSTYALSKHKAQAIRESLYRTDFDNSFLVEKEKDSHFLVTAWRQSRTYKDLVNAAKCQHVFGDVIPADTLLKAKVAAQFSNTASAHGNIIRPKDSIALPTIHLLACLPPKDTSLLSVAIIDADMPRTETATYQPYILSWIANVPADCRSPQLTDAVIPYLPPHPAKGTGEHRICILVYRQTVGTLQIPTDDRFIHLFEFSNTHKLEPIGLSFFRSEWDDTVPSIYDSILHTKEPIFVPPSTHLAKKSFTSREKYAS